MRSQALLFIKRMYEKEQLREYVEKFALNYLQLLVHPNPPSVLFGADKDTGLAQVLQRCSELGEMARCWRQPDSKSWMSRPKVAKAGAYGNSERVPGSAWGVRESVLKEGAAGLEAEDQESEPVMGLQEGPGRFFADHSLSRALGPPALQTGRPRPPG